MMQMAVTTKVSSSAKRTDDPDTVNRKENGQNQDSADLEYKGSQKRNQRR